MKNKRLGMVGLGKMGKPMARNLLSAGFGLMVYDLNPKPVAELVAVGARGANSLAELGQGCEVVLLSLLPATVEGVIAGEGGLLASMQPGGVIIDAANSDPAVTRRLAEAAQKRGLTLLDAAVSGGPEGSRDGTLAVMVGGDQATYQACLPLFQAIGRRVVYFGGSGNGHLAKIVNNLIVYITGAMTAEAVGFGIQMGLDPRLMTEAMTVGAARSWVMEQAHAVFHLPDKPGWEGRQAPRQAPNQFTWALDMAQNLTLPMPYTALAHELQKLEASDLMARLSWEIAGPLREEM